MLTEYDWRPRADQSSQEEHVLCRQDQQNHFYDPLQNENAEPLGHRLLFQNGDSRALNKTQDPLLPHIFVYMNEASSVPG